MTNANRRLVARIVVPLMLLPLAPFAGLHFAAAWTSAKIEQWRWPERITNACERVHLWSLQ